MMQCWQFGRWWTCPTPSRSSARSRSRCSASSPTSTRRSVAITSGSSPAVPRWQRQSTSIVFTIVISISCKQTNKCGRSSAVPPWQKQSTNIIIYQMTCWPLSVENITITTSAPGSSTRTARSLLNSSCRRSRASLELSSRICLTGDNINLVLFYLTHRKALKIFLMLNRW